MTSYRISTLRARRYYSKSSSPFLFVSVSFFVSLHPLSDVWPAGILHAFAEGIYGPQLYSEYGMGFKIYMHSSPFFVCLNTLHLAAVLVPAFS